MCFLWVCACITKSFSDLCWMFTEPQGGKVGYIWLSFAINTCLDQKLWVWILQNSATSFYFGPWGFPTLLVSFKTLYGLTPYYVSQSLRFSGQDCGLISLGLYSYLFYLTLVYFTSPLSYTCTGGVALGIVVLVRRSKCLVQNELSQ